MKKLIAVASAFAIAGCHTVTTQTSVSTLAPASSPAVGVSSGPSGASGAADATGALRGFLTAGDAQNLNAMGTVWGSAKGPARDGIAKAELEKRELIMFCYLKHDHYDVMSDAPSTDGSRIFAVKLAKGTMERTANFTAVEGPQNRWYIQSFDMEALTALCWAKSAPGKP